MIALIAYKLTQVFPKLSERAAVFGLWALTLLLLAGALWGAYAWAYDNGRDAERAKWEAAAEILEDAAAIADAEALDVAAETKKDIDDANERATAAASGSSDPLRDAFGSLRKEGAGGSDKASR